MMYSQSITQDEILRLERLCFPGNVHVISKLGPDYDRAIEDLSTRMMIGFDTETRPNFSKGDPRRKVSLLQLSSDNDAYLFRVKKIGLPETLSKVLTNEKILKIGAAVRDDIRGLNEYSKFKAKGFVDLQKMVGDFGIKDISVKKMSAIILGVKISKKAQMTNWDLENLTSAQLSYAATDAWICLKMYERLQSTPRILHDF